MYFLDYNDSRLPQDNAQAINILQQFIYDSKIPVKAADGTVHLQARNNESGATSNDTAVHTPDSTNQSDAFDTPQQSPTPSNSATERNLIDL
jgi:hypothetical protein